MCILSQVPNFWDSSLCSRRFKLYHVRGLGFAGEQLFEVNRPSREGVTLFAVIGVPVIDSRYAGLYVVKNFGYYEAGYTDTCHM